MQSIIRVTAVVTDEVTAVELTGTTVDGFDDTDRTSTGWAKKHPKDEPDEEIAFNLAMSRALQQLSNKYGQQAADLAGFPVDVALDEAATLVIEHAPDPRINVTDVDAATNRPLFGSLPSF
jgi:hypothetical protein